MKYAFFALNLEQFAPDKTKFTDAVCYRKYKVCDKLFEERQGLW